MSLLNCLIIFARLDASAFERCTVKEQRSLLGLLRWFRGESLRLRGPGSEGLESESGLLTTTIDYDLVLEISM